MNIGEIKKELVNLQNHPGSIIACKLLILKLINNIMRYNMLHAIYEMSIVSALQQIYKNLPDDATDSRYEFVKGNLAYIVSQYEEGHFMPSASNLHESQLAEKIA